MRFGIIREGKVPPDARVALVPQQCASIHKDFDVDLVVQPSKGRIFADQEYLDHGVSLQEDLRDRDILLGVKEVPIEQLIPNKTYLFFSHTIKAQPYNRDLLRAILAKNIRLIDYEVLTDGKGKRLIAFGKFAGMVGAHNGLLTYGKRTGQFGLKRMHLFKDYAAAKAAYQQVNWPKIKVVVTGTGRVGIGATLVLDDMGFQKVAPQDFLNNTFDSPVYTQLKVKDYVKRKDGQAFVNQDFYQNPAEFESIFQPFTQAADLMINGIYWDNAAPAFFTLEEMQGPKWAMKVIADVTCDIAPVSSIPSTLRATTIQSPFMGFDPHTGQEVAPFQDSSIDMMTIDNLPNELPRDASEAFGNQFIEYILPEFYKEQSAILERATIAQNGQLGKYFQYLQDYVG